MTTIDAVSSIPCRGCRISPIHIVEAVFDAHHTGVNSETGCSMSSSIQPAAKLVQKDRYEI